MFDADFFSLSAVAAPQNVDGKIPNLYEELPNRADQGIVLRSVVRVCGTSALLSFSFRRKTFNYFGLYTKVPIFVFFLFQ